MTTSEEKRGGSRDRIRVPHVMLQQRIFSLSARGSRDHLQSLLLPDSLNLPLICSSSCVFAYTMNKECILSPSFSDSQSMAVKWRSGRRRRFNFTGRQIIYTARHTRRRPANDQRTLFLRTRRRRSDFLLRFPLPTSSAPPS